MVFDNEDYRRLVELKGSLPGCFGHFLENNFNFGIIFGFVMQPTIISHGK